MKVVQSFFTNTQDLQALDGGYFNTKYHLMGWALSACLLKKHHERVELLTDSFGKQLLVDELGLPYTSVKTIFDDFETEKQYEEFWLLKKVYGHTQQNEPFIFLDGDAFMFQPFEPILSDSPLIAQNINKKSIRFYTDCVRSMVKTFDFVPDYLRNPFEQDGYVYGCCTGVTGGADTDFYKHLYQEIVAFLDQNKRHLNKANPWVYSSSFNVTLEEAFFFNLARERGIPIRCLIEKPLSNYADFMNFHQCPEDRSFLHLMFKMKSLLFVGDMVEKRLMAEFPEMYQKIRRFADQCGLCRKSTKGIQHFYSKFSRSGKATSNDKSPEIAQESSQASSSATSEKTGRLSKGSIGKVHRLDLHMYEKSVEAHLQNFKSKSSDGYDTWRVEQITNCRSVFEKKTFDDWLVSISPFAQLVKTNIPADKIQVNHFNFYLDLRKKREHYSEDLELKHVLIHYNPSTKEVIELRLLSERILFHWIGRESISLRALLVKINVLCKTTYKFYLRNILIDKLKFFIYHGALSLKPNMCKTEARLSN